MVRTSTKGETHFEADLKEKAQKSRNPKTKKSTKHRYPQRKVQKEIERRGEKSGKRSIEACFGFASMVGGEYVGEGCELDKH